MAILKKKEFERRLQHVESLILEVDALEGDAKRSAADAIRALLELHGDTIDRMLELVVERGETGQELIREFGADEMVGGLLLLHGLHPLSLEERVQAALATVRPYLGTHGGDVELLGLRDGVAHLRLQGSCHGCPSSTVTLKYAIEKEIAEAAPDLVDLVVEGVTEQPSVPAGFIPLTAIKAPARTKRPAAEAWQAVAGLESLASGQVRIEEVDGSRLLFCMVGDTHLAYRDGCPACGQTLENARLDGALLACANCGRSYDVQKAGRSPDGDPRSLAPIPLLRESGEVRVAAAAAAAAR